MYIWCILMYLFWCYTPSKPHIFPSYDAPNRRPERQHFLMATTSLVSSRHAGHRGHHGSLHGQMGFPEMNISRNGGVIMENPCINCINGWFGGDFWKPSYLTESWRLSVCSWSTFTCEKRWYVGVSMNGGTLKWIVCNWMIWALQPKPSQRILGARPMTIRHWNW